MKKLFISVGFFFILITYCFTQTNFTRGEELFIQNRPRDALVFLENAVADDPAHMLASMYLGIVYEQLGRNDDAIVIYRRIHSRGGDFAANISANMGNVYFRMGNLAFAEQFYSQSLSEDTAYSSAYLGRANTRIKTGNLRDAVTDYEAYLRFEPRSPKRPQIEQMITYIRSEFAAEERRKLMAEQAAREEAERRQRLLDDLAASLQSAAGDSQGLSTGTENLEGYDGEFELD